MKIKVGLDGGDENRQSSMTFSCLVIDCSDFCFWTCFISFSSLAMEHPHQMRSIKSSSPSPNFPSSLKTNCISAILQGSFLPASHSSHIAECTRSDQTARSERCNNSYRGRLKCTISICYCACICLYSTADRYSVAVYQR